MLRNIIYIILLPILFSTFLLSEETLGIVTKSKGKVEYRKYSSKSFTSDVNKGLGLFNNDRIKTGENGFSIYRYLDDASSIKILKNSDILIQGRLDGRLINKTIDINNGILKLDIAQQDAAEFSIVTPTSVATIKGTKFWLICNGPNGDRFYGIDGRVEVKNIQSGATVLLTENSTVVSSNDGNLIVQSITSQELEEIDNLEEEAGESQDQDIDSGSDDIEEDIDIETSDMDEENILKIQFEDSTGNLKEIVIKYK